MLGLKYLVTPQLWAANRPMRGRALKETVAREAAKKPALSATPAAVLAEGRITARIRLKKLDVALALGADVFVTPVLFLRKATTQCTAGENKGRTLVEYFVVCDIGDPKPAAKAVETEQTFTFALPEGERAANLGVAFLVEDRARMKTLECWSVNVTKGA